MPLLGVKGFRVHKLPRLQVQGFRDRGLRAWSFQGSKRFILSSLVCQEKADELQNLQSGGVGDGSGSGVVSGSFCSSMFWRTSGESRSIAASILRVPSTYPSLMRGLGAKNAYVYVHRQGTDYRCDHELCCDPRTAPAPAQRTWPNDELPVVKERVEPNRLPTNPSLKPYQNRVRVERALHSLYQTVSNGKA